MIIYNKDIENKLLEEYENKYLHKFITVRILDTSGKEVASDYFKVTKIKICCKLVEFDEGNMLQIKIKLLCQNYIRIFLSGNNKNSRIENSASTTCFCGFEGLKDNIERFVTIIDKQTFKNILKLNVNKLIHTL